MKKFKTYKYFFKARCFPLPVFVFNYFDQLQFTFLNLCSGVPERRILAACERRFEGICR